jgi:hypothetical protein
MEKWLGHVFQNNFSGGVLLLGLIFIAILLIKINGNLKDLKEHFSLGVASRYHGKKD